MGSTISSASTSPSTAPSTPESALNGDSSSHHHSQPASQAPTARSALAAGQTTRKHLISLARAHNKFAISLYQEFAKDPKRPGSFIYSPLSMGMGLGLLYMGAEGSSEQELFKCFHLYEVQKNQILPAFAALHWDLIKSTVPKGCVLEVALRLFAQLELKMTKKYEDTCVNYELTKLRNTDFRGRPDVVRKDVNKWVEDRTQGRLRDVVPLGVIDNNTRLFMMCAIYLKAQWFRPFEGKKTSRMPFYLPHKETPEVNMMNQQNRFRCGTFSKMNCDALELPFANGYLKMYILLPQKLEGISKLENKISRGNLENLEDVLQEDIVDVFLPRFKYELGFTIGDKLQKVGIKEIFQPGKANLKGLTSGHNLALNRFFHHVFVEVDEAGSGHSSQTSVHTVGSSDEKPNRVFRCDHPFLFYVRDDRTGALVLLGRVVRPQLAS